MNRENLPALTGLRFIAAIMIVVEHSRGMFMIPTTFLTQWQVDNAVSFFFILSGFILTHVYGDCSSVQDRRKFYVARFARIWPVHVACIILLYAAVGDPSRIGTTDSLPVGLLNLALLQSWFPNYHVFFSYNAVSWSISCEALFYALFPFISAANGKTIALWLLGSCLLVVLMAALSAAIGAGPYAAGDFYPTIDGMMYINPASRLLEFVLGICAARLWLKHRHWMDESDFRSNILQFLAVASFLYVIKHTYYVTVILGPDSPNMQTWFGHGGTTAVFSAFIIYAFASTKGALRRVMSLGPVVYLGEISFCMYMVHQIPTHVYYINKPFFDALPQGAGETAYFSLAILLGIALHHLVEEPFRRLIVKRLWKKPDRAINTILIRETAI
ncbi:MULTISPECIES: acyltransferase family protein [unclassified Rhizobium]